MAKTKENSGKIEMILTQALNELKLLDKRITKVTQGSTFVGYSVGGKVQNSFNEDNVAGSLTSVTDLIARRARIKGLIYESNLKTKVTIGGKKMTVSDAILVKETIPYKRKLLNTLKSQYETAEYRVSNENDEVQARLDNQTSKFGDDKTKAQDIADFSKNFIKMNGAELIDPANIPAYALKLDEELDNFENEVDFILSTSNATTTILV